MIHSNYEKLFQIKHFLSRNDKGSKTHNFAPVRQLYEAKMQGVMLFALAAKSIFDITLSLFCPNHNGTHPATRWCCFSKQGPIRSPNEKMDQSKARVFSHFYHRGVCLVAKRYQANWSA